MRWNGLVAAGAAPIDKRASSKTTIRTIDGDLILGYRRTVGDARIRSIAGNEDSFSTKVGCATRNSRRRETEFSGTFGWSGLENRERLASRIAGEKRAGAGWRMIARRPAGERKLPRSCGRRGFDPTLPAGEPLPQCGRSRTGALDFASFGWRGDRPMARNSRGGLHIA